MLPAAAAAMLSGCGALKKSPYPEVEEYLENLYEQEFVIEEVSEGGVVSYQASPKDRPALSFKVLPAGEEYTNKGFDDTYPAAFVRYEGEKLGLRLEPGEGDKEFVISVDRYDEVEALGESLSKIAGAYEEAGLPAKFTLGTVENGWNCADIRVEIKGPEMKGYEPEVIHIPDSRQIGHTDINDADQIKERIGSGYVSQICQYYLGDPLDYLTPDAVTAFYADEEGMTLTAGEDVTEYPYLSMGSLHFGEVYRLAQAEGWEPAAEQDSFSITANGLTSRFFLEYEDDAKNPGGEQTARVYWEAGETGERLPAWGDYSHEPGVIYWDVLEERTGSSMASGLTLQKAEERKEENREKFKGYLNSGAGPVGSGVEIGNWAITVKTAETTGRITSGSMYFDADEGKEFVRVDVDVANQGTEKESFLPMVIMSDELLVELATSSGHKYTPVDLLGGGDMTGASLEAGETKSGYIVFHVSQDLLDTEEHVLLLLTIGKETKAVQIK